MTEKKQKKQKRRRAGGIVLACLYALLTAAVLIFAVLLTRFMLFFRNAYSDLRAEIAAREEAEAEASRQEERDRTADSGGNPSAPDDSGENGEDKNSEESGSGFPSESAEESGPEDSQPEEETSESEPVPETPSAIEVSVDQPDGGLRIWVGDSRTVGIFMNVTTSAQDIAIAEVGMTYVWFDGTAVPQLEQYIRAGNVSRVFINMGVNDCAGSIGNPAANAAPKYAARINGLIEAYPAVRFIFYSVGPGNGSSYNGNSIAALNEEVDRFNSIMYGSCRAEFLDLNGFLKANGFGTLDGLHYDAATCREIYQFVIGSS